MYLSLRTLLLLTVASADSRYSWSKYKSIVRDDGLRKGSPTQPLQDKHPHDDSPEYNSLQDVRAASASDGSSTETMMQATASAGNASEMDAAPEVATTNGSAVPESEPSPSRTGNSSNFVETGEAEPAASGGESTVKDDGKYPYESEIHEEIDDMFDLQPDKQKLKPKGRGKSGKTAGLDMGTDGKTGAKTKETPKLNFEKSDAFFQEIVEDTKYLAEATVSIQEALKNHDEGLTDIKEKAKKLRKGYQSAMQIVSNGFGQVKAAASILADKEKLTDHNQPVKSFKEIPQYNSALTPVPGPWGEPASLTPKNPGQSNGPPSDSF